MYLATGDKVQWATDYTGWGDHPLVFQRGYNLRTSQPMSAFGHSWASRIDAYAYVSAATDHAMVVLEGGQAYRFYFGSGSYGSWGEIRPDKLVRIDASTLRWASSSGEEFTFIKSDIANKYKLTSWRAADGYTWTLTRDASFRVSAVTDSFGRQMTFTWTDGVVSRINAPGLVIDYEYQAVPTANPGIFGPKRLIRVTRSAPGGGQARSVQYHYEDPRYDFALTGITDERGVRSATYTYDDALRVVVSEGAGGANRHEVAYNTTANTRTVTGPLGRTDVYNFATRGGRLTLTSVNGQATPACPASTRSQSYSTQAFITGRVDEEGRSTTYLRDANGKEISRTEAAGTPVARTLTTTWHAGRPLPTQTTEPGLTTAYTYDAQGRLLTQTETDTTGN